ncbi:hypothetical protein [Dyadobacter sp. 32]|uniref:hypothetical protein n=1 Tax=Dyadobacter sp. 32 TaxID=538966 RepID=UPI0011EE8F63
MKKQVLPKFLLAALFALITLSSFAQEGTSSCPDPAKGCDTVAIERKVSPWRVGGFLGPAVAFCGSWEATFNSNKYRDKALFNGIGFNAALNADYYFKAKDPKQLKFGLGAMAGLQNFFFRKDINPFIDKIISESGSTKANAEVRKGASEDHYFVVGPVLSYSFTKKPRSIFLEASARGGIFRSTPAAIFIYDRPTGNNIYSVTATNKRYHAGLLATLGVFLPSKNGLWAWGIEAIGFRTKLDYIFPGATVYPYDRKHGGFSAGVAMRRNFAWDIPVPKAPTPPVICLAPELEWKMGDKSVKGLMFNTATDTTKAEPIMLTWKTRNAPDTTRTETFTARIHHLDNGVDKVIASVICQEGNQLAFPAAFLNAANGRPLYGQYYATVHSQATASCGSCVSEASSTGFAVKDSVICDTCECNKLYNVVVSGTKLVRGKSYMKYVKSSTCEGCLCPAGATDPKMVRQNVSIGEIVKSVRCEEFTLNLNDEIQKKGLIVPKGVTVVNVSVEKVVVGKCADDVEGRTTVKYSAPVKDGKIGTFTEVIVKKKK